MVKRDKGVLKLKKKKWFLLSGISGILAVICLVFGFISVNWKPSKVVYEVAEAFGNTAKEDFLIALPTIMLGACLVFLIASITLLVVGVIKNKKRS